MGTAAGQQGAGFSKGSELSIEAFYRLALTPWFELKPDLQLILDPGGDEAVDNTLAATVRLVVRF